MSIFDIDFASLFGVLKAALIQFVRQKRDNNDPHYDLPMKCIVAELIKDDLWAQNMLLDLLYDRSARDLMKAVFGLHCNEYRRYVPSATVFVYVNCVQLSGDIKKKPSRFLYLGTEEEKSQLIACFKLFQPSAKKGRKNKTTDSEDNSSASSSNASGGPATNSIPPGFILKEYKKFKCMKHQNLITYTCELTTEFAKQTDFVADLERKLSEEGNKQNVLVDDLERTSLDLVQRLAETSESSAIAHRINGGTSKSKKAYTRRTIGKKAAGISISLAALLKKLDIADVGNERAVLMQVIECVVASRGLGIGGDDLLQFNKQARTASSDTIMVNSAVKFISQLREFSFGFTDSEYVVELLSTALWSPNLTKQDSRERFGVGKNY